MDWGRSCCPVCLQADAFLLLNAQQKRRKSQFYDGKQAARVVCMFKALYAILAPVSHCLMVVSRVFVVCTHDLQGMMMQFIVIARCLSPVASCRRKSRHNLPNSPQAGFCLICFQHRVFIVWLLLQFLSLVIKMQSLRLELMKTDDYCNEAQCHSNLQKVYTPTLTAAQPH